MFYFYLYLYSCSHVYSYLYSVLLQASGSGHRHFPGFLPLNNGGISRHHWNPVKQSQEKGNLGCDCDRWCLWANLNSATLNSLPKILACSSPACEFFLGIWRRRFFQWLGLWENRGWSLPVSTAIMKLSCEILGVIYLLYQIQESIFCSQQLRLAIRKTMKALCSLLKRLFHGLAMPIFLEDTNSAIRQSIVKSFECLEIPDTFAARAQIAYNLGREYYVYHTMVYQYEILWVCIFDLPIRFGMSLLMSTSKSQ